MATIESAVRAMLLTGSTLASAGIPDARVAHGYRLQDSILPACTFELQQAETLAIGSNPLKRVQCEIRIVAERTQDAIDFIDQIQTLCVAATYDSIPFNAVEWLNYSIEAATTSDGDENQPAELACYIDIYYTEA